MIGYKVFTHNLRPPIQGGEPVWDGAVPFDLPQVEVDTSNKDCGAGWNFCRDADTALRIGGLWPNGRPSRLFRVEPIGTVVERGDKCRTSQLRIVSEITDLRPAITALSSFFDPALRDEMVEEQLAWREALARPMRDEGAAQSGLREALEARELNWTLMQFESAWSAPTAGLFEADGGLWWSVRAARAARSTWSVRSTWSTWSARSTWNIRDAMVARNARNAWSATRYTIRSTWHGLSAMAARVGDDR